jgi:hypothetical protein
MELFKEQKECDFFYPFQFSDKNNKVVISKVIKYKVCNSKLFITPVNQVGRTIPVVNL